MIIKLSGTTFHVSGRFPSRPLKATKEAVIQGGGKVTSTINAKTEVLLGGTWLKRKEATSRGLPIVTPEESEVLIALGEVEIEFESPLDFQGTKSLEEVMGELRSLFEKDPSPEGWRRIFNLLESCDSALHEPLADYVNSKVDAHWSWDEQWFCLPSDRALARMIAGLDSPLHQVVRRLDLYPESLKASSVTKALKCKHLNNLRFADLNITGPSTKTYWRTLLSDDARFAKLEHLDFDYFSAGFVDVIPKLQHPLRSLSLKPHIPESYDTSNFEWLYAQPSLEQLDHLILGPVCHHSLPDAEELGWRRVLQHKSMLPSLRKLSFDAVTFRRLPDYWLPFVVVNHFIRHPRFEADIEELCLKCVLKPPNAPRAFDEPEHLVKDHFDLAGLENLKHLQVLVAQGEQPALEQEQLFWAIREVTALDWITVAPSVQTMSTNIPQSHPMMRTFENRYPLVKIEYTPSRPYALHAL